jgi:alpha-amylase/alpha-mannosidase (GH57 family)
MPLPRIDVVLLWHMHQPDYRDYATGEFVLPWTYLHALKDYSDMAAHLEAHPGVRAVVNFVPVLLDQIEDYSQQLSTGQLRDPLLRLLVRENLDEVTDEERGLVLHSCWQANPARMIEPFPGFRRLRDLYQSFQPDSDNTAAYLSGQYLADLLTWYHIAWTGESVRRTSTLLPHLLSKGQGFTLAERRALLDLIRDTVCGLLPRYRKLAEGGRVEFSTTPHFHPLAPLLIDFSSTHEALPDAPLPGAPIYPGGRGRMAFHLESAMATHAERFGHPPRGVWPAEGAVSQALLEVCARQDLQWMASGEGVLANSLRRAGRETGNKLDWLYRPWRVEGTGKGIACFFRDDRLSDLIGFEYCRWHGSDAAAHFVAELESIARAAPEGRVPVVSIILDGENAWEFYPYNGYYFFSELYSRLEAHPFIRTATYSSWLDESTCDGVARVPVGEMPRLSAGSWVYGNFATWIGSPDKNHAWDLLVQAKQSFDLVIGSQRLTEDEQRAAMLQLASCESSDWFWWFGDYNSARAVASFDHLYRQNLTQLYRLLKLPVPAILSRPISVGGGTPEAGGTMRRAS